jgi:hypothetical protein
MAKASFNKKTFHQPTDLKLREEASTVLHVEKRFDVHRTVHRNIISIVNQLHASVSQIHLL